MIMTGDVVRLETVATTYANARAKRTRAQRLWPKTGLEDDVLVSCSVAGAVVTSCFVVVDPVGQRMFLDQSYANVELMFPTRFTLTGTRYLLSSDPIDLAGEYLVLGGPIDRVWYHWLFNWCPRLLLLAELNPDLFSRPDLRILVHPVALEEPYRAILDSFGFPLDRFVAIDPDRDYRLETAHLVSFLDQNKLYPDIVLDFADHLLAALDVTADARFPGLFASRQGLAPPKRRIANFASIQPVLDRHALRTIELDRYSARKQAQLFHNADVIVGGHGSDLANLLFCRAGTSVIVIENQASVAHNLHIGLAKLAEILGLDYRVLISPTTHEPATKLPVATWQRRDYVVNPQALDTAIEAATKARRTATAAGVR